MCLLKSGLLSGLEEILGDLTGHRLPTAVRVEQSLCLGNLYQVHWGEGQHTEVRMDGRRQADGRLVPEGGTGNGAAPVEEAQDGELLPEASKITGESCLVSVLAWKSVMPSREPSSSTGTCFSTSRALSLSPLLAKAPRCLSSVTKKQSKTMSVGCHRLSAVGGAVGGSAGKVK